MPKGYWITWYRSAVDPSVHANYAALAGDAITACGGRFLARGIPSVAYEGSLSHRCVVIEFSSVSKAISAYESSAYQGALAKLNGSAEREVRILEGVI